MSTAAHTRPFTVDEFHRMARAGILTDQDHVELIDGDVIAMTPIGPRHAALVGKLTRLLSQRIGSELVLYVQNPLQLDPHTEMYPDLMVLRPRPGAYEDHLPVPQDVLLLIEVAEHSLQSDQQLKLPRYATAGTPEVWIVDVAKKQVAIYNQPSGSGYQNTSIVEKSSRLIAKVVPQLSLTVNEIFS